MSQYFDTDRLIESIKRRINIPEHQSTFTKDDLLAFANEELSLSIVPAIMSLHEDYLLFTEDVPVQFGVLDYTIPYRAVGNKLYDLQFVDENARVREMHRIQIGAEPRTLENPFIYSIRNNKIRLMTTDGLVHGSLRFLYYIKPANLVDKNQIGVISSINRQTGVIAVSNLPSNFTTIESYDFYKVKSPHSILAIDLKVTGVNPTTKTLTFAIKDIPSDLEVGDHVALSGQSCIPQIPSDLHVYLAQKVAERILEAQGDNEGLAAARGKSAEMEMRAGSIIDNRVDESPIKLVNHNGVLRSSLRRRRF